MDAFSDTEVYHRSSLSRFVQILYTFRTFSLKFLNFVAFSLLTVCWVPWILMATNNWRPPQVREPSMDAGNWGSQLQLESRQRIVNMM